MGFAIFEEKVYKSTGFSQSKFLKMKIPESTRDSHDVRKIKKNRGLPWWRSG